MRLLLVKPFSTEKTHWNLLAFENLLLLLFFLNKNNDSHFPGIIKQGAVFVCVCVMRMYECGCVHVSLGLEASVCV